MKLAKASLRDFRCIDYSHDFTLSSVTCLVGKNESGKTALLVALERLNPYDPARGTFDKLLDYPRKRLADYEELHPGHEANVLETYWSLEADEVDAVEQSFGPGALKDASVCIRKGYDNKLTWVINLDQTKIAKHLITHASLTDEERTSVGQVDDLKALADNLGPMAGTGAAGPQALHQAVTNLLATGTEQSVANVLFPFLPKFLYFSSYDRMNGSVQLDKFTQDVQKNTLSSSDKVFRAFLDFAGVKVEDLRNAQKYEELKARVEAASIKISQQIFQYWSQNKNLKVEFSVDSGRPNDPPPLNSGPMVWVSPLSVKFQVFCLPVLFAESADLPDRKCGHRSAFAIKKGVPRTPL